MTISCVQKQIRAKSNFSAAQDEILLRPWLQIEINEEANKDILL